jgi:SNF2 family DNA or RNA helicase
MVKVLKLRQIACTTAVVEGQPDHSTKLERATEMAQEIVESGEPVVIWTQFRAVQEAMVNRLEAVSIQTRQLHGDIHAQNRPKIVQEWTEAASNGQHGALVCMIQVAGVGLTMTAASHAIFLDRLWTPKLNEQAEDRLHRIGQKNTVNIHVLQIRNSIEQRVEAVLAKKGDIFDAVVEQHASTSWKKKIIEALVADDEDAIDDL